MAPAQGRRIFAKAIEWAKKLYRLIRRRLGDRRADHRWRRPEEIAQRFREGEYLPQYEEQTLRRYGRL